MKTPLGQVEKGVSAGHTSKAIARSEVAEAMRPCINSLVSLLDTISLFKSLFNTASESNGLNANECQVVAVKMLDMEQMLEDAILGLNGLSFSSQR